MKYYVYSPIGRTASIRLLHYIDLREGSPILQEPAISTPTSYQSAYNSEYGVHVFKCVEVGTKIPRKEEKLDYIVADNVKQWIFTKELTDLVPDGACVHSHTCMWAKYNDWTHILSTRRDKTELPMSLEIAIRSGDWTADPDYKTNRKPFEMSTERYLFLLKRCERRERAFLKGVKKDTGKDAVKIYLEDTPKEIEEKLGIKIPEQVINDREIRISSLRPNEFILNYEELKEVYNDFIENKEYHMNIWSGIHEDDF